MGEIAKQGGRNAVLMYTGAAVGFVNTILLFPKVLPKAEYGLLSLLIGISVLVASISNFGAPNALIRFFPHFRNEERQSTKGLVRYLLSITMTVAVVVGSLMLLFQQGVFLLYKDGAKMLVDYYYFIFPMFLLQVIISLMTSWLNALKKSHIQVFQKEILIRVGQTCLIGLYYIDVIDIYLFVILFTMLYVVSLLFLASFLYWSGEIRFAVKERLNKKEKKEVLNFSTYTFLSGIARQISFRIDGIMVGALVVTASVANSGLEAASIYAVALNMSAIIEMPYRALNQSLSPSVSSAWARKDLAKVNELYEKSTETMMAIGVYVAVGIWACVEQILEILPSSYAEVKYVLGWLLLGKLTNVVAGANGTVLMNSPKYKVLTLLSALTLVLTVVTNYIFIGWFQIEGAALATFMTYVTINFVVWFLIYRYYKLQPFKLSNLLVMLLGLVVLLSVSFLDVHNLWLTLFVKAGLITVVFWGVVYFTNLSPEIKKIFDEKILVKLKKS